MLSEGQILVNLYALKGKMFSIKVDLKPLKEKHTISSGSSG